MTSGIHIEMENKVIADTRNFLENERQLDDLQYFTNRLRRSLEADFLDTKTIRNAVNDYKSHTKRFFIHATMFLSFKHPVKEIEDFYKLLKEPSTYWGDMWYPEWKPLVLYILSKLMCDLHQVHGHTEMRKFRASMRREILVDLPYKTTMPFFIYDYKTEFPYDDNGHFMYASIFFDESPCDQEEVSYQRLEFEAVSVLNRRISYEKHLKRFGLVDKSSKRLCGYPQPVLAKLLRGDESYESDDDGV